ncbi:hypothetical protein HF086_012275 [Spodoptera exigua]|uniref:Uncharacterized protein n=1 Tax=Spodoptera exigua TaxID=7107 RepID=A0A922MF94_SPOEX|nr:hypothetical protein HF086_012275 [Spodoptera exigua]
MLTVVFTVDILTIEHKCGNDKAIQVIPPQEHKAIQVSHVAHYRSKFVQISTRRKNSTTSPFKTTVCTATSPFKMNISQASTSKLLAKRKLNFFEEESDDSFTPATEGSTVDYESSQNLLRNILFFQKETTLSNNSEIYWRSRLDSMEEEEFDVFEEIQEIV